MGAKFFARAQSDQSSVVHSRPYYKSSSFRGRAARSPAPLCDAKLSGFHPRTLGAEKEFDARASVARLGASGVRRHIAQNMRARRKPGRGGARQNPLVNVHDNGKTFTIEALAPGWIRRRSTSGTISSEKRSQPSKRIGKDARNG